MIHFGAKFSFVLRCILSMGVGAAAPCLPPLNPPLIAQY